MALALAVSAQRGLRPGMEDFATLLPVLEADADGAGAPAGPPPPPPLSTAYAAIFDGHNGPGAARYAGERLHGLLAAHPGLAGFSAVPAGGAGGQEAALRDCFHQVDDEIIAASDAAGLRDGTTALVCLRLGGDLLLAHVGDSRAVACCDKASSPPAKARGGGGGGSEPPPPDPSRAGVCARGGTAHRLTEDHTAVCAAEAARVQAAGGELLFAGCWRVISCSPAPVPGGGRGHAGGPPPPTIRSALAVTRALGDAAFKRPSRHVIATPDVLRLPLCPQLRFVLLATDGVWDVLSDQEACEVASAAARRAVKGGEVGDGLAARMAEAVTKAALKAGTADNVTCVVILPLWKD